MVEKHPWGTVDTAGCIQPGRASEEGHFLAIGLVTRPPCAGGAITPSCAMQTDPPLCCPHRLPREGPLAGAELAPTYRTRPSRGALHAVYVAIPCCPPTWPWTPQTRGSHLACLTHCLPINARHAVGGTCTVVARRGGVHPARTCLLANPFPWDCPSLCSSSSPAFNYDGPAAPRWHA